ncbi:MAG: 2-hydroxyacyl-CoA dehydratase family protein [Anaerolineae bacterium]|jgi:bcr-type benzoyl-CoA reductase subunit C
MTEPQALKTLFDFARARLTDWPARFPGYRAMGYLCSYVPAEIIHAAGYTPLRLRGTTAPLHQVDAHLQSFTCALCRSTLDQVLGGELDFLAGTVFAHTCDTMQAQADLWRLNTGASQFVDTVMQPTNLGSLSAAPYLIAELNRFREALATFGGQPIRDSDLRASITFYDEMRRQVTALGSVRGCLSAPAFFAVLDAAQAMPPEEFNPLLAELLAELEDGASSPASAGGARRPRIFLAGAVLDEPRLLDLIEGLGAHVAGDDLCSGSRHFYDQVGATGDPIANLASYYLRRPPCPTKYHPDHDPGRHLLDQALQANADGVVFALEKFCEPHAFDYARIRPTLDEAAVPSLLLEMEQVPSLEALRTRLQAFIEML